MKRYLPVFGSVLCIVGGFVAISVFVWFYELLQGPLTGEGIGFGAAYPWMFGIACTYFFLRRYFPAMIEGEGMSEPQTAKSQVFGWVMRVGVIFVVLFIGAVLLFALQPK